MLANLVNKLLKCLCAAPEEWVTCLIDLMTAIAAGIDAFIRERRLAIGLWMSGQHRRWQGTNGFPY